jgi:rod shape-determining protein MreC
LSSQRPEKTILHSLPLKTVSLRLTPAVLVLLAASLMILHRAGTLPVERLRVAVMDAVAPVLTVATAPFNAFVDNLESVTAIRDLKAENIRLEDENIQLRKWYESALKLQAENQSFRELLNVKADPDLTFVTARVIADAGGTFVKSVLLPVGAPDKIQKGNAVMSGRGLVGRVTEVGRGSSRVLLVTDLNSRIPVILQDTRTRAILAGKNQDLMKLERLPPDSGITVGTRVVTSGDGGQLPADLPVGVIVSSGEDGVWVSPLSDIDRLTHVQVINADVNQELVTGEVTPPRNKK